MNLGARLEGVISLLSKTENNRLFADIGSDHAYLAIEILKRNIADNAIAADINPMPLEKGRENAISAGIEMDFILSDGFDGLETFPLTSAAVCGMGGELMGNILLRSRCAKECDLVLQPMSAQEELRRILWDNGFDIKEEIFVTESGKPYVLMLVRYDGIKREYSYIDLYLGKFRPENEDFALYLEKVKAAAKKRRLGLVVKGLDTAETDELIKYRL